jgi:hypothetical protein
MHNLSIPVQVLIRPRSGDFHYSNAEFDIMKENILQCKELGCAGIVSGVLCADNTIDIKRNRELIELSKPMSFTFHRAFDVVPKPKESLLQLINLGVNKNRCVYCPNVLVDIPDFKINNILLYQRSFIHTSYCRELYKDKEGRPLFNNIDNSLELQEISYETMEFLGDSILGSVVVSYLYERFYQIYNQD